jgi:tetratricopeptide (TPR) repeat protein
MIRHHRLPLPALGLAALCALALAPRPAAAFSNVAVGDTLESVDLPTLAGAREAFLSPAAQANVFIFFRPQQENSLKALRAIAECERDFKGKPVHWVAVVSSSWQAQEVRATVAAAGTKMPVIVDQNDALYGKLGVRLHPVVGIANGKFQLVAYEPFSDVNYCDRIRGQVRYALGEISRTDLARADAPEKALMPNEIKGAVSGRHVKMGEMYLGMEQFDKAAAAAKSVLDTDPKFAPAHVLLGDALSAQGKCAEAKLAYQEAVKLSPQLVAAVQAKKSPCGP